MRVVALLVACLSSPTFGQYLQVSSEHLESNPLAESQRLPKAINETPSSKLKLLALLLSKVNPADAFNPIGRHGSAHATFNKQSHSSKILPEMKANDEPTRRSVLAGSVLSALAATLAPQAASAELTLEEVPIVDDNPDQVNRPDLNPFVLKAQLLLILRVKEATTQETRLIESGKYKTLQRLDVKRAIKFMLYNYQLRDRFGGASAFAADYNTQLQANKLGIKAVDALQTILDYFPEDLKANDLTDQQKNFVLKTLKKVRKTIDQFCDLMPTIAVKAAEKQLVEENKLNAVEYPEDEEMLNVNKTAVIKEADRKSVV